MSRAKLAIVCTHPIQYYAPVFRALAASGRMDIRAFYTWSQAAEGALYDRDFRASLAWDVPLLDGYASEFVPNTARRPGPGSFRGIVNPTLNDAIESWGADAILVYGWNLASHLRALRYFKDRIPVLFRGDSTLLDPSPWLRRLARRCWLRWVYSHVDVAVSVGANNRDYFAWCGVESERIAWAPHSVDTARFNDPSGASDAKALHWRRSLRIPSDALVYCFVGKFISKKDPLRLLSAFERADVGAFLVFVGGGDLEGAIRARAARRDDVRLVAVQNQSEMPAIYRLGDVLVLPSVGPGETWGLAINEAMACGRPAIVSSRVGAGRDLVHENDTGWTFAAGDTAQLARALRTAADAGPGRLRAMGERARAMMADWSTAAAANAIEAAVLGAILTARRRRDGI